MRHLGERIEQRTQGGHYITSNDCVQPTPSGSLVFTAFNRWKSLDSHRTVRWHQGSHPTTVSHRNLANVMIGSFRHTLNILDKQPTLIAQRSFGTGLIRSQSPVGAMYRGPQSEIVASKTDLRLTARHLQYLRDVSPGPHFRFLLSRMFPFVRAQTIDSSSWR